MRTERDAYEAMRPMTHDELAKLYPREKLQNSIPSTAPRPGYVRKMPSSGKRLAAAVLVATFYLGVASLVVWGVMRLVVVFF